MLFQMERVGNQEDIVTKGQERWSGPLRHPDHRLADRAGGEDRRGPGEDRPRDLQPPRPGDAAGDRRRRALRHAAGGSRPDAIPFSVQRDTPGYWNTYQNTGLPPTPIANPGRASIRAALNPAPNPSVGDPLCVGLPDDVPCEYLYYVLANEEGGHAFAVTPSSTTPTSRPPARPASWTDHARARLAGKLLPSPAVLAAAAAQRRSPDRRSLLRCKSPR